MVRPVFADKLTDKLSIFGKQLLASGTLAEDSEAVTFAGAPPPVPLHAEVLECLGRPSCAIGVVRRFLAASEVASIFEVVVSPEAEEVENEAEAFANADKVYRLGKPLRLGHPKLFHRLLGAAWGLDRALWRGIVEGCELWPEVHVLEHVAAARKGDDCLEPRCDDDSVVSLIIMLSDREACEGGVDFFDDCTLNGRKLVLRKGDAVFFSGRHCERWMTPVTKGRRLVLKMDLSLGDDAWCGLMVAWLCCMVTGLSAAFHLLGDVVHPGFRLALPAITVAAAYIFPGRANLPPSLRCSQVRQGAIVTGMLFCYCSLVALPSLWDRWLEYHLK